MSDETNIDPIEETIKLDWPSIADFNSLDRTHGRKFDFDYEPTRETATNEGGTDSEGTAKVKD